MATKLTIQAIIFNEDGNVYDMTSSGHNHPAQVRLEKAIAELEDRKATPAEELEIVEILTGKTMSDLENAIVRAALDTLQAAINIVKFNMNPCEVTVVA
jgi:hypothetical protein